MACAFCGRPGRSREHVFPRWIDRLLETGTRQLEHARYGEQGFDMKRSGPSLDFVVNRVCAECNNGWMSEVEANAQSLLTGLIYGQWPGPLTPAQQWTLSLWAVKTCLVLDLTQRTPSLDKSTRLRFRQSRNPPGGANVWVAVCEEIGPPVTALTVNIELQSLDQPDAQPVKAFYSPIKLGHLVLLAAVLPTGLAADPSPSHTPWVRRIAPMSSPLVMPPWSSLGSGTHFETFADEFWRGWSVGSAPGVRRGT